MTREQADMIDAWNDGRIDEARALGKRVQRLADVIFDAPVANYRARTKEALHILGVPGLEDSSVRPPLIGLDDAEKQRLSDVLVEVGLMEGVTA